MRQSWLLIALSLLLSPVFADDYYPASGSWETQSPPAAGFDSRKLAEAVRYARENAETEPKDLSKSIRNAFADREPHFEILGPTKPRAESSGMIVHDGRIVAEWGDTRRVDMTFSVTKSYLSTVFAVALKDGAVRDVHDRAADYVRDGTFDGEHNRKIEWHHLLHQTSDWQGSLWGRADWEDRPVGDGPDEWRDRPPREPGTHFKYNDVRVNLVAYSLLQTLREPLPRVLRERVMDPIGASSTWRWHGYGNSWVNVDGLKMQSVSGGGHFGGGMFISTRDHARFGLLFERDGRWADEQLLPETWTDMLRRPAEPRPDYGYMWWLNTDRERIPEAPESAYWAAGFGGNYVYVDEENDLVVVLRWVPDLEGVIKRVMAARK